MTAQLRPTSLADLVQQPGLGEVIIEQAFRGARLQRILRLLLVGFFAAVLIFVPPDEDLVLCWLIIVAYGVWSLVVGLVVRLGGLSVLRWVWLAIGVDVVAVAALTLVAAEAEPLSWTAYLLISGFYLVPLIAATSLSPWICAAAVTPTVGVFLVASLVTREVEIEPISSPILRTALLAGVGVGCVLLSRLQRSRVLTIGGLVRDRSELVGELLTLEQREQRDLAETLHDGSLQYVLAARQDLEDLREPEREAEFDRVEYALSESSRLLRSTMAQLHPAVLESAGLPAALRDLATTMSDRGRLPVDLDVSGWPAEVRTSADSLLLNTARELLTNVIKHAEARRAELKLILEGKTARLQVSDDGRGMGDVDLERRLADRHIGLASRRIRVEAAGGLLTISAAVPHGTVVTVEVPAEPR
jgi:two-component system, NarL family, sensor kinase